MKITDVKLRFAKHYLFVQVYTDAGITGLGEAGNWGYLQATAATIEKFADYLIGKDPFRIEDFNQNFLRSVYFRGSVIMRFPLLTLRFGTLKERHSAFRFMNYWAEKPAIRCAFTLPSCI